MALSTLQVQEAYVAFFNRPADLAGLNFWTNTNLTQQDMMTQFAASAEYTAMYAGLSNMAIVNKIYMNLFGHPADMTGLLWWTNNLDTHADTVAEVAYNIGVIGAQGTDAIAFADKVVAATDFTNALTVPEALAYAGANGPAFGAAFLAPVHDAGSLGAAVAGLHGILAAMETVVSPPAGTLTLTTNADTLNGTTFNAPLEPTPLAGSLSNSLQSGDTLTGQGVSNVLSADLGAKSVVLGNNLIAPHTTNIQTISLTSYDSNGYNFSADLNVGLNLGGNNVGNIGGNITGNVLNTTGNNTLSNSYIAATILAGNMTGVTNWVDGPAFAGTGTAGTSTTPATGQGLINPLPGSRADLVIENIQLPNGNTSSDVTSAVTFTLRNTEPGLSTSDCYDVSGWGWIPGTGGEGGQRGHFGVITTTNTVTSTDGPNFGAYFDPEALKQAVPLQSNTVVLAVGNATPLTTAAFNLNPVSNPITVANPTPFGYSGFTLGISGNPLPQAFLFTQADILTIEATTGAAQEAAFLQAVKDAIDINNGNQTLAQLGITASTGVAFNYADQVGVMRSVPSVLLTGAPGTALTAGNFVLLGTTIGISGQQNEFIANPATHIPNDLITSNIILDKVGLGAMPQYNNYSGSTEGPAGNVVIGSLASSGGVQQFNVDVQNGSWINSLSSTNNTLQVVYINSDAVVIPNTQFLDVGAELSYGAGNLHDYASPGLLVGYNGFTDVQTIDAVNGPNGAFNGSLLMGETIDYQAFVKYLQGGTPQAFSITLGNQSNGVVLPGQTDPFNSVHLLIDSSVAASGNFSETITGGTGNDLVDVMIGTTSYSIDKIDCPVVTTTTTTTPAAADNWVTDQTNLKNLVINDAAGNNIIAFHNSGAAVITTGPGNDTFYIDNSGGTASDAAGLIKAVWVANGSLISTTPVTPVPPTAVATTAGTNLVPGTQETDTITWGAFTAAAGTQTIDGITVTSTGVVAFTAAQVATVASGGSITGLSVSGTGWTVAQSGAQAGTAGTTFVETTPYVATGVVPTGTATGSGTAPTGAVTTAGTATTPATAETQTVTWHNIQGIGASETIGGITVTDTTGAPVSASTIAGDVLAASLANPGGTSVYGPITVFVTDTATGWTATSNPGAGPTDVLTYGTPGATGGTTLVGTGTSTVGFLTSTRPIVSIDQYGNFTTNANGLGASPHTFTGAGEQVTVSFDGYTTTANALNGGILSADVAGATYTTAQINNAIMNEVNTDPVMNKLLHVTLGSAGDSLIISSLVDGQVPVAPTINFSTAIGTTNPGTTLAADVLALNDYAVQVAHGDGVTSSAWPANTPLTGLNASGTVNNSTINDAGGTNVIDLSSAPGSVNTVHLTGTGTSYLINVGHNEVITTVPTHLAIINAAFGGDNGTTVTMGGDTNPSAPLLSGVATPALLIAAAVAAPLHTVLYEVFGGNTFYADHNGTLVELVGTPPVATVAGGPLAGHLVLG